MSQTCLCSLILLFQCLPQLCLQGCGDCLPVVAQDALQVVLYQHLRGCDRIRERERITVRTAYFSHSLQWCMLQLCVTHDV